MVSGVGAVVATRSLAADARTISVSPTQVSMPIVDRWLDQAPERLPLLVDALLHRVPIEGRHGQAIRDWRRSLTDLRSAISAFNPDGFLSQSRDCTDFPFILMPRFRRTIGS